MFRTPQNKFSLGINFRLGKMQLSSVLMAGNYHGVVPLMT
jgi:hypothetical protein